MKKIKKLSAAIIVLAMCVLLGTTAWALNADGITYSATLDNEILCVSGIERAIVLTIKTNKPVAIDSLEATLDLPADWTIYKVSNPTLGFNGQEYHEGRIAWFAESANDVSTDVLAVITINVPADAPVGEYQVGLKDIMMSKDYGTPWEDGASAYATVTIQDHAWSTPSYTDNDDGTHTASYVCGNDANHTKTDDPTEHDFTKGDCVCGTKKPGMKGDLDLDGDVDSNDLTLLARHVAGIEKQTGQALENADVDGDGDISSEDITVHARYIAGIIKEWP